MTFAARTLGAAAAGFTPVTHSYTSGSGIETVPVGASRCVITEQAAGSGSYYTFTPPSNTIGGNAGGEAIKTIAVAGGDTFSYAVGAPSAGNSLAAATASHVSGTVTGGSVNMVANGGGAAGSGTGGTAIGGDTNLTGGNGSNSGVGGVSPHGGGYGNGGGAPIPAAQGGITTFAYT